MNAPWVEAGSQYVFPHPLHRAYWFLLVTLCFNGLPLFQWTAFYHLSCNVFAIKMLFQLFLIFMTSLHRAYWFLLVTLCFNGQLSCNVFAIEMLFQLSLIFMTSGIKISETQCICCTSCPQNILKNCPTPISWSIKNDGGPRKSSRYFDFRHLSTPANAQPYSKAFLSCESQILLCGWRKYVWLFLRNPR